jgi:branched-chain amino acid transport system substrate-binding protein
MKELVHMRSKSLSLMTLAVVSVIAAGPSLAQQPIRIGASIAISGRDAVQGGYVREGYLLCQKHVNEKGGILGRPMEFVIRDDDSDPKAAAALYEKLITEDKVDAVIGPYGSAMTDAAADVTEKHRKLMVAPAAGTTSLWEKGRRYLVMVVSPLEAATEGTIDLAARHGLKTIALINADTLTGKAVAKGTLELAKKKGLEVVFHETYLPGTTDFSAILSKVKAVKPDVLLANYVPAEVIAITRQMRELDVNVKMFSATPGAGFLDYEKALGKTAEFVSSSTPAPTGIRTFLTPATGSLLRPTRRSSTAPRPLFLRRSTPAAISLLTQRDGPGALTPTSSGRSC